jgi:polysaccharide biosynthesis/export protein
VAKNEGEMKSSEWRLPVVYKFVCAVLLAMTPLGLGAQTRADAGKPSKLSSSFDGETTQSLNARLAELAPRGESPAAFSGAQDYRIGPEDLLSISVFEAPDLGRDVRVSAAGQISLPLIGEVHASGLSSRQLEAVLEELLRRTYMKDPHVSVFVKEMESHPVSVFGAVKKPGVFQVRTGRSLIEVLSLAEGLAEDAGDTVIVMRHDGSTGGAAAAPRASRPAAPEDPPRAGVVTDSTPAPATAPPQRKSLEIDLRDLLRSGDPRLNVMVYPGDVVKVTRAGIVYVVGEVRKPGGYLLKTNENVSILQALALAGGLTRTSASGRARIIRTETATGARREVPVNISRILQGKDADQMLQAKDIVFIPNSAGKAALYHGTDGIFSIVGSALIYRY